MSPMPINFPTKRCGWNFSKSSGFSPTPINLICAPVTAHADSAPPPFAVPSNLVTTTPVTFTDSWNICACFCAA